MTPDEERVARSDTVDAESAPAVPRLTAAPATGPIQVARRMFRLKAPPSAIDIDQAAELDRRPWQKPSGYLLSLILFVAIPTIASMIYLVFIASDQYVAEARFAIRTRSEQAKVRGFFERSWSYTGAGESERVYHRKLYS